MSDAIATLHAFGCKGSDGALRRALEMCGGDTERAANFLLDKAPADASTEQPRARPDKQCGRLTKYRIDETKPEGRRIQRYPDLGNGDCIYHIMWMIENLLQADPVTPPTS